jgi:hypothetical protein
MDHGTGEVEITVVCSGRNDNWNGSFDRVAPYVMRHNAAVLARRCRRFEQVFVEWAPLEDRPLLSERLHDIGPQVVCYVVPRAIHDGFRPGLPFLQYHARNVGLRRARGRRVVATNADILLTPEVVDAVMAAPPGMCLRAPRYDVSGSVIEIDGVDAALDYCADPRNRVAEHEIVHRHTTPVTAWFENAAGDFAAMHREDWTRARGFHERIDASMGVDAELIGQARRLGIDVIPCDWPVYHVDHPEQQAGRLHMPPFSSTGYDNPTDWGLGIGRLDDIGPQIRGFDASQKGIFSRVSWPPPLKWPEAMPELSRLCDWRVREHYDAVVFCGLSDPLIGFSLYLDLDPRRRFVWDDGLPETRRWRSQIDWPSWFHLEPEPGVLFVATADSPAARRLLARGAEEGPDFWLVDPNTFMTASPVLGALHAGPETSSTLVLLGFGTHGRFIADLLQARSRFRDSVVVWDDDPAARAVARRRGWSILPLESLRGAEADQWIVVTPAPCFGGTALVGKLHARGLIEGRDYVACPFGGHRRSAIPHLSGNGTRW